MPEVTICYNLVASNKEGGSLPKRIGYFKRIKTKKRFGLFTPLQKGGIGGKAQGKT